MAEPLPRERHRGRPRPALLAAIVGLACLFGLASQGAARAGLIAEPVLEPRAAASALAAMQVTERASQRERLVDRLANLERRYAATLATRLGNERRLRRLASDFAAITNAVVELDVEADQRLIDVSQKQQRLEALLAEIVQLSRDETGDPRRLAQLRAVAASLARPFAAAKAALAETRAAQASLADRISGIEQVSVDARQALLGAEARADRLARAIDANRLLATEASSREHSAIAASLAATRRLDRVVASRDMATFRVTAPAVTAGILASSSLAMLEAEALTARATVALRPVRGALHYDLPEMTAILPPVPAASGTAGAGQVVPVAGAVISRFGEGQKPPFDRGLTIEVEDRRLVRAPREGRVVFARAYEGFGLLLIIDHGNEYHSLLSGLSRFVVHEGWTVRAGQMVGTLEPGAETTGRLYVELRRRGVPVDPLTWFAAGQDKVRS
jgi:murein hydrolase activator